MNSAQPTKSLRVLVVEDNTDQWRFIELAFKHKQQAVSITPVLATSEQQALSFLQGCAITGNDCPRLMLLDLYLPRRENSLAFLQTLRRQPEPVGTIPVVMLTVSDQHEDMTASFQGGINAYMVKPATFADWLDCMQELKEKWLTS